MSNLNFKKIKKKPYTYIRKGKRVKVPAHSQKYRVNKGKLISLKRALSAMNKRSKPAITRDSSKKAKKVYSQPNTLWLKNMGRSDVKGIDTPKKKKDFVFRMKNKTYKSSDVVKQVKNNLKKTDGRKLNAEVNREYKIRSERALKQNPHWKMYEPSKEKYLNSLNISREKIKKEKQGEIIQKEFNNTIHRRVKAERAVTEGTSLKNISDETLIKNLNIIRSTRKHEVGMKYKKKEILN